MDNTTDNNLVMGKNSALISDGIKNYKHKIYKQIDFFAIPFDLNNLERINSNQWCPAENDKEYMSQSAFDDAVEAYEKHKAELYFNNVRVNYDSCDCGGGYPCSHGSFPYEIEVSDKKNDFVHIITIDGYDSLIFNYKKTEIGINGLENFTYGDFIRFCKLCDITLESNYVL